MPLAYPMRIAIDIDSTLHHYWDALAGAAQRRFGVRLPYEEQVTWAISALRPEQLQACIAETHSEPVVLAAEPYPGAVDVVRRWREANMTVPILVLTARGSWHEKVQGIDDGADDYVSKPFSPAELILRVRRLVRPPDVTTPAREPIHHGPLVIDRDRHEVTVDGNRVPLTPIEFALLAALIEAGGRVLTREQLLDAVHGPGEAFVLDRTVDVHVRRLRRKLGDEPARPRFVATVRGVGYRAPDPAGQGQTQ